MSSLAFLACMQCLQMEPLFNESKDRLMVKIAGFAEKGEAANALEYVRHMCLIASSLQCCCVCTSMYPDSSLPHKGNRINSLKFAVAVTLRWLLMTRRDYFPAIYWYPPAVQVQTLCAGLSICRSNLHVTKCTGMIPCTRAYIGLLHCYWILPR